jgi:cytosine/creatinine deaminase
MLIEHIDDARLPDCAEPCALELADGRVRTIARAAGLALDGGARLRAHGALVLPAFVDAHVHLDKAFLLDAAEAEGPVEPRLASAIERVARLRTSVDFETLRDHAVRAVQRLVGHGVGAARAHVELDPSTGLPLVELELELARSLAPSIDLQLVAFPQRGLEAPGMRELMVTALERGVGVVGGCPYVDRDPASHLDFVFAQAERRAAPLDLHLDFSDDPGRSLLGLVLERTHAHGLAGRVTLGHVTTLAAMNPDARARALDAIARAGIALVLLPATDLFLAGHGDPGTRSLAPFEQARAAGVRAALANNNLQNPFAPYGNCNLLMAAWLTGITQRISTASGRRALLEAITTAPAQILELPAHGPEPGALAHLALVDAERVDQIVLQAPPVLATLHGGTLVQRSKGLGWAELPERVPAGAPTAHFSR